MQLLCSYCFCVVSYLVTFVIDWKLARLMLLLPSSRYKLPLFAIHGAERSLDLLLLFQVALALWRFLRCNGFIVFLYLLLLIILASITVPKFVSTSVCSLQLV